MEYYDIPKNKVIIQKFAKKYSHSAGMASKSKVYINKKHINSPNVFVTLLHEYIHMTFRGTCNPDYDDIPLIDSFIESHQPKMDFAFEMFRQEQYTDLLAMMLFNEFCMAMGIKPKEVSCLYFTNEMDAFYLVYKDLFNEEPEF